MLCLTGSICRADSGDTALPSKGISVAFWQTMGNYQGAQIGLEYSFFQNDRYKVIGCPSLVVQHRADVVTSGGIILEHSVRRTFKPGLFLQQGFRLGYLGSYFPFDVYKTDVDGNVINVGRVLNSAFLFGSSIALGYDFRTLTKVNIQLFIRPNLYFLAPNYVNWVEYSFKSIEAGITFHPIRIRWFAK
jgi:hypothetical protein